MSGQGKAQHRVQHNGVVCPDNSYLGIPPQGWAHLDSSTGGSYLRNNFSPKFFFLLITKFFPQTKQNFWPPRRRVSGGSRKCSMSQPAVFPTPLWYHV